MIAEATIQGARPQPKRPTFLMIYCDREGIKSQDFVAHIFNRILARRKRLLSQIARKLNAHFFDDDERLIEVCGTKQTVAEVKREISEYFADRHNWGFWRGKVEVRISTERLRLTAAQYLE